MRQHPWRVPRANQGGPSSRFRIVARETIIQLVLFFWYLDATSTFTAPESLIDNGAGRNATSPATPSPDPPPAPGIPSSSLLLYACLTTLAILPRFWLGMGAVAAYGGNMLSTWWQGVLTALTYQTGKALCPGWLQWFIHIMLPGAPFPISIAGIEWTLMAMFCFILGFSPAVAFVTYQVADAFIHPLRRQMDGASAKSELLVSQRNALAWFGRSYSVIGILDASFPSLLRLNAIVLAILGAALIVGGIIGSAILPGTYVPESQAPKPGEGQPPSAFKYTPLKDTNTIRVLRIEPSLTDALPVRCSLLQVSLGQTWLSYNAVSHKWPASDIPHVTPSGIPRTDNQAGGEPVLIDEAEAFLKHAEQDGGDGDGSTDGTDEPIKLLVNGYSFAVHPDILGKLRGLRSTIMYHCVWIDNICIDQENKAEQAQQVSIMDKIYEHANHVIACLVGLEEGISHGALHQVRRFFHLKLAPIEQEVEDAQTILYRLRDSRLLQDFSANDDPSALMSIIGEPKHWAALHRLVVNPWFRRVWMLQEVAMAERIELRYCGIEIHWDIFTRAMAALRRSGLRDFPAYLRLMEGFPLEEGQALDGLCAAGIDGAMIYDNLRRWRLDDKLLSLLDTLILCLRFQSREDVDRIFAMLGIIPQWDRDSLQIKPDYHTDKNLVFQTAAWRLLALGGPENQFRMLRFAGVGRSRRLEELPSWVPDWTAGLQEFVLEHRNPASSFKASRRAPQRVEFIKTAPGVVPNALKLKGYLVDVVVALEDLSETPPPGSRQMPAQAALRLALRHATTTTIYPSLHDAFWRTLVADSDINTRPASEASLGGYKNILQRYEELQARTNDDLSDEEVRERQALYWTMTTAQTEDRMFSHLLVTDLSKSLPDRGGDICSLFSQSLDRTYIQASDMTARRQFCVTQSGYMGLVPRLSRVGDVIVVFHGAGTPHILRKRSSEDKKVVDDEKESFELVGECYVHGLMDGQAAGEESVFIIV